MPYGSAASPGPTRRFIALAGGEAPAERLKTYVGTAALIAYTVWSLAGQRWHRISGVQVKFVDGKDLCDPEGAVGRVYREFVPRALAERHLLPAPEPLVVGTGLEKIRKPWTSIRRGVSAKKVVVSLKAAAAGGPSSVKQQ